MVVGTLSWKRPKADLYELVCFTFQKTNDSGKQSVRNLSLSSQTDETKVFFDHFRKVGLVMRRDDVALELLNADPQQQPEGMQ